MGMIGDSGRGRPKALRRWGSGAVGLVIIGIGIFSCQSYPFVFRPEQSTTVTQINELAISSNNTDILFMIDNSGSMVEERENLKRNTQSFIATLAQSDNIFRIGIAVPDLQDPSDCFDGETDSQCPNATEATDPGANLGHLFVQPASVAELAAAGCVDGNGDAMPVTVATVPWLSVEGIGATIEEDPDRNGKLCRLQQDFITTVDALGTSGTGWEQGLAALQIALQASATTGEVNEGFIRDNADLTVVIVSDEDDCSYTNAQFESINELSLRATTCYAPDAQVGFPIDEASFVDALEQLKTLEGEETGIARVSGALIGSGYLAGESGSEFVAAGCRIAENGVPSGVCGCWSSTAQPRTNGMGQPFCQKDEFELYCQILSTTGALCADGACNLTHPEDPICDQSNGGSSEAIPFCEALAPTRYARFIGLLGARRAAQGLEPRTFTDSICNEEYDQTLETIASSVVLSECFNFDEPLDQNSTVVMERLVLSIDGDQRTVLDQRTLEQCDAANLDSQGECNSCTAANGNDVGWYFQDEQTLCLTCGYKKDRSILYSLQALNEDTGE